MTASDLCAGTPNDLLPGGGHPHMRRREFIRLLGGAAVAWPMAARAQQAGMPVIGFLHQGSVEAYSQMLVEFRQGLKDVGFVEGQNVSIEFRWAGGQYARLPELAADLVRRQVTVITAALLPAAEAAKAATTTIPIVFNIGSDPVRTGLVSSIRRPDGNLTGMSRLTVELGPKRLELLREVMPSATVMALLVNPTNPTAELTTREARDAAQSLGLQLQIFQASTEREIDAAFAALAQPRPGGLLIHGDTFFLNDRRFQIIELAARHAIPTMYSNIEVPADGGLMAYGANLADIDRQYGVYTGRILKGEKPADLPVQQSAKVELIINLKTAKTLGITFPLPLLGRADKVIE
jgi:putative ABC transport system substrate-binding protein